MIKWTDIGDGFKAWVVNDRPVLVMDASAKDYKYYEQFRYAPAAMLIEHTMGWRTEMSKITAQVCAVVKISKIHDLDYFGLKDIPTIDPDWDDKLEERLELAGLASYSSHCRLKNSWNGHPPGSTIIWKAGSGKQKAVAAVIEKHGLESILAMVLEQGGLLP